MIRKKENEQRNCKNTFRFTWYSEWLAGVVPAVPHGTLQVQAAK